MVRAKPLCWVSRTGYRSEPSRFGHGQTRERQVILLNNRQTVRHLALVTLMIAGLGGARLAQAQTPAPAPAAGVPAAPMPPAPKAVPAPSTPGTTSPSEATPPT